MSFLLAILLVGFAALSRFVPHPPNFAPIAAMALFGGVYLEKRFSFIVPLAAMLISDYFIGFHNTMPFVYGSFILIALLGVWLRNHKTLGWIIGSSVASSVLFFVVTNFGVWVMGGYPQNFAGLVECYVAAIPFFRNTLFGDLLYVMVLFGLYETAIHVLKLQEIREV